MHFNVLSFIVRALLYAIGAIYLDENFICYSNTEYWNLSFDLALDICAVIKILNAVLVKNTLS